MNNSAKFALTIILGYSLSCAQATAQVTPKTNCPNFGGQWLVRAKNVNRTVLQRLAREYPTLRLSECYWQDSASSRNVNGIQMCPFPTPQTAGVFYQYLTSYGIRSTDVTIVNPPSRPLPTVKPIVEPNQTR